MAALHLCRKCPKFLQDCLKDYHRFTDRFVNYCFDPLPKNECKFLIPDMAAYYAKLNYFLRKWLNDYLLYRINFSPGHQSTQFSSPFWTWATPQRTRKTFFQPSFNHTSPSFTMLCTSHSLLPNARDLCKLSWDYFQPSCLSMPLLASTFWTN